MKAIFLLAGHGLTQMGGVDDGAVGSNTTERSQVVAIASQLLPLLHPLPLEIVGIGIAEELSLSEKIQKVNYLCTQRGWSLHDAILIELHMNAGMPAVRGVEGWYGTGKDSSLASTLVQAVTKETGLPLRNPPILPSNQNRYGRLGILDDTIPTSALMECGFVTNILDVATVGRHTSTILGLYKGILSYLHLPLPVMQYLDVPSDAWYAQAVADCLQAGILQMPADQLFRPGDTCTRAEMAVMFSRLLQKL